MTKPERNDIQFIKGKLSLLLATVDEIKIDAKDYKNRYYTELEVIKQFMYNREELKNSQFIELKQNLQDIDNNIMRIIHKNDKRITQLEGTVSLASKVIIWFGGILAAIAAGFGLNKIK